MFYFSFSLNYVHAYNIIIGRAVDHTMGPFFSPLSLRAAAAHLVCIPETQGNSLAGPARFCWRSGYEEWRPGTVSPRWYGETAESEPT